MLPCHITFGALGLTASTALARTAITAGAITVAIALCSLCQLFLPFSALHSLQQAATLNA